MYYTVHYISLLHSVCLIALGCFSTPIVELWNKIDLVNSSESVRSQVSNLPIDVDIVDDEKTKEKSEKYSQDPPLNSKYLKESKDPMVSSKGSDLSESYQWEWEESDGYVKGIDDSYFDKSNTSGDKKKSRNNRKIYYVAASVKTGLGLNDFMIALEVIFLNH